MQLSQFSNTVGVNLGEEYLRIVELVPGGQRGRVRGGWNDSKARVVSYDYMPYGETRVESGRRLDLGYTGHKWDEETKQYYAAYRY